MKTASGTTAVAAVMLLAVELLVIERYQGPPPVSEAASDSATFSAIDALRLHHSIFPDEPHPVGSAAQARVRRRLVTLLQSQGWSVEVQSSHVRSRLDEAIEIHNIIARRPELSDLNARPLVLSTHYDSCRFGPGAGDAAACVCAVVEAGRLLTSGAFELQRPVCLVITDAEEEGLLGAAQLVSAGVFSAKPPLVLNFDARGTSGPVVMYETHAGNLPSINAWINHLASPRITGSLFAAIYRTLPNGTDFSVFSEAGWQGLNFAVIDGAHHYHQPTDTRDNLDLRSLQHFGNHALELGSHIATAPGDLRQSTANAVFFDLLGTVVVQYSTSASLPLALVLLVVVLWVHGRKAIHRSMLGATVQVWAGALTALAAAGLCGFLYSTSLMGTAVLPRPFVAHGHWLSLLLCGLVFAVVCTTATLFCRRIERSSVWDAFWTGQAVCTVLVAWLAPEFSHLALVPGVFALLATLTIPNVPMRVLAATAGGALLLIPVQHLLSIAVGPANGIMLASVFAVTVLPLFAAFGQESAAGDGAAGTDC